MNKIKVLLAEDEASLGMIVKESLESRDFIVFHAENGEEAFEMYQKEKPDVLVLDVMMPKKDGFTLAKEIRLENKKIPILFLTAKSQTADVLEGFNHGGKKNEVLDRTFILNKLWGNDDFFNARSMDVFISKLRKKLKKDNTLQIINIRGFGYKLIC